MERDNGGGREENRGSDKSREPATPAAGNLSPKMSRRRFLRLGVRGGIGASTLGLGSVGWARRVEPRWIEVVRVELRLKRLAPAFDGYRVAHISDLHADDWMTRARLRHVVQKVNAQRPDFVAITGDLVTLAAQRHEPDLVDALSRLRARDGGGAVLGNHDHWTSAPTMRRAIRDSGLHDLNDAVHTLQRPDGKGGAVRLHFAGVNDMWAGAGRPELVLEQLAEKDASRRQDEREAQDPRRDAAILLVHEPDFADEFAAAGRFDLQLSGHSHGGQVRVPGIGPLRLPPFGSKYHAGLHRVGAMLQYTTRGVGMVSPRVRFCCRPEITVFTLRAA